MCKKCMYKDYNDNNKLQKKPKNMLNCYASIQQTTIQPFKKNDADFTQTWKYGHKNFQRADM